MNFLNMHGIKDLVGLLFWMNNDSLTIMQAVSSGQRKISPQKKDILHYIEGEFEAVQELDLSKRPTTHSRDLNRNGKKDFRHR